MAVETHDQKGTLGQRSDHWVRWVLELPRSCLTKYRAFNYPFQLTFGPLIGAIAGGNTAVVKPPEQVRWCAALIEQIMISSLEPSCYTTVQGGIPETTALLEQKWDKIFYTGNATVGRIIAKAAIPNLTPVTLELGGRNPAIVTKSADTKLAARRCLWGKILNAGQVCISENYILVDKAILPEFIMGIKEAWGEFYPKGVQDSKDFGRLVSSNAFHRVKSMIDNSKGKIILGGEMNEQDRYIEPTVVQVDDISDSLIAEESFGPVIPIMAYDTLDDAIRIANDVHSTPLSLYVFGNKAETSQGNDSSLLVRYPDPANHTSPQSNALWRRECQ